jgi:hypothetical protein
VKISRFAISGLEGLRNLRICDNGMIPIICGFSDKKHLRATFANFTEQEKCFFMFNVWLLLGGLGKRAWNSNFSGGLGKRAWNSNFSGGLGKRAWNSNFSGGLGKRAWNSNFSGGLGKRAWNNSFSGNIQSLL